jgi:DNA-3-methyladenine glycosylase
MSDRLPRSFFRRDPVTLALALLGQRLVRVMDDGTRLAGRIVEVEAYLGVEDLAAHTARGRRTRRNESMWLDGGHAYVYFTYGMHHCMNVVAQGPGDPTACLIRAVEPLENIAVMRAHRSVKSPHRIIGDTLIASGPARLTQAFAIDRSLDGQDMVTSDRLFIEAGPAVPADRITTTPRIGVAYAGEWAAKPLRFYEAHSGHVSVRRAVRA